MLATKPAQPVTLEIHDAAGDLVQHSSSADTVAKLDPAKLRTAPQWVAPTQHLSDAPGMHRYVWSLQYAPPKGGDPARPIGGAWAPPGDYRVTLTVDGKALDRTLTLVPDPRVKLEATAYQKQFELAKKVEATLMRVTRASTQAGTIRKNVVDLRKNADGPLADTLDAFQARLTLLSGEGPSTNPANVSMFPPKRIESLRWLSGALTNVQRMVDGADAMPSSDSRQALAKLEPMVDATLEDWQRFSTVDLEALNQKLRSAGQKAIALGP
jgi:hypothetical protein